MPNPLRCAALACLIPVAALAADRPNVKPGLWEVTRETTKTGLPQVPEEMLARLPPESRARMQAMGGNGPKTMHLCVTDKDLERLFRGDEDHARACTRTVVSQTATAGELSLTCQIPRAPAMAMHGTVKWQVTSPTSATSTVDLTGGSADHPVTSHSQMSSKWLGADCGDVKPDAPAQ